MDGQAKNKNTITHTHTTHTHTYIHTHMCVYVPFIYIIYICIEQACVYIAKCHSNKVVSETVVLERREQKCLTETAVVSGIKPFLCNCRYGQISRSVLSSLMFVVKSRAYPSGACTRWWRFRLQIPTHVFVLLLCRLDAGNTKGGSITVLLTSCSIGLDQSVLKIKIKIISSHTADSKQVKQEVNSTVILPLQFSLLYASVANIRLGRKDESGQTLQLICEEKKFSSFVFCWIKSTRTSLMLR